MVAVLTERRTITRVTLRCVPLTPVHIGDGSEMRLDEYVLEEPQAPGRRYDEYGEEIEEPAPQAGPATLARFDPARAMRRMADHQHARFRDALDRGDLTKASRLLRDAGRACIEERIAISDRSRRDLKDATENPGARTGQVKPFVRSNGRPYVPGSSIKGAFRTALASAALPKPWDPRSADPKRWHAEALEAALGIQEGDTASDPLRYLSVADAMLPVEATLIDKTEIIKPGGIPASSPAGGGGIQMHYEILRGRASHPDDRTTFDIELAIDSRAPFDRDKLIQAASRFHWAVWRGERQRFFASQTGTGEALDRHLRTVKVRDKTLAEYGPAEVPNCVLLRLGRFGHFESKSLEGVRRGHFPQARNRDDRIRKPNEWGATRTVIRDARNNAIPFGWVLGWATKEERL